MFECSLYGLLRKKFEWAGENFRRIEKTYSNGTKKAFVYVESTKKSGNTPENLHTSSTSVVVFKETPDKNKQRISVVSKITKVSLPGNVGPFLAVLGYEHSASNVVEGFRYLRNGYQVEITKLKKADNLVGGSEGENASDRKHDVPAEFLKLYLVKVFVETENVNEGEMLLENAFQELCGQVKLVKPSLSVF